MDEITDVGAQLLILKLGRIKTKRHLLRNAMGHFTVVEIVEAMSEIRNNGKTG